MKFAARAGANSAAAKCRSCERPGAIILVLLLLLGVAVPGSSSGAGFANPSSETCNDARNSSRRIESRKLLGATDRHACSLNDISISQRTDVTPGAPQYTVQIANSCMASCAPSNIHLSCGWFASAPLINPKLFKRVGYNDCLVNNGKPLEHGTVIRWWLDALRATSKGAEKIKPCKSATGIA